MAKQFTDPRIRFLLGDVRDRDRLWRAFDGVDIVIHAAALKQVPAAEYNPFEAVRTNVLGTANVIDAALDRKVGHVMAISTDKAVAPVNLYGATKSVLEKLMVQANAYSGRGGTLFAVCRYGNVIGSRGSVVPLFMEQRESGRLMITSDKMTRFLLTLDFATGFIKQRVEEMRGGELFVPIVPSVWISDLATAIAPEAEHVVVGVRPGEKIHETLISLDESPHALRVGDHYRISADVPYGEAFSYTSENNEHFLNVDEIRALLGKAMDTACA